MDIQVKMQAKLTAELQPTHMELVDDSARHAGHAGAREGGQSHFKLYIVSQAFAGKTAVQRHRMVYGVLADELKQQVHALNVVAKTPDEVA